MPPEDLGHTPPLRCAHCGNLAPLTIRARDARIDSHNDDFRLGPYWEAGTVFEILVCPACEGTLLAKYLYHSEFIEDGVEYQVLFPSERLVPRGLPEAVAKAYDAASRVRNVEANAFGVLLRRVMELVCRDRGATGRDLSQQLSDLAAKGEIPGKLVDVANGVRHMGNVGAHAGLGELTSDEVAILDDLTRAVLEYVYSAPLLANKAAERLAQVKARASRTPPVF